MASPSLAPQDGVAPLGRRVLRGPQDLQGSPAVGGPASGGAPAGLVCRETGASREKLDIKVGGRSTGLKHTHIHTHIHTIHTFTYTHIHTHTHTHTVFEPSYPGCVPQVIRVTPVSTASPTAVPSPAPRGPQAPPGSQVSHLSVSRQR